MFEDRLLRLGLIASLMVNGLAISLIGVAGTLKPLPARTASAAKPPTSRLIEITMLAEEKQKAKEAKDAGDEKSGRDSETGDGKGSAGTLADSNSGPMGKLNVGHLARTQEPQQQDLPKKAALQSRPMTKPLVANAKKLAAQKLKKRNIKVAVRSKLDLKLGTIHLKRPGSLITGGYHGVVDLRKMKLTAHLVADNAKVPVKLLPNKYIGKSHTKVIGKASSNATCTPTGGHTVYASDLTILMGPGIHITGTKYCVPGGFPGIPGSAGQTNSTGTIRQLTQGQSQGGGQGSAHLYTGGSIVSHKPAGESGSESGQRVASATQRSGGPGEDGASDWDSNRRSEGKTNLPDETDTASQQALQDRYERMATGPLRGNDMPTYAGSQGTATRALHLPEKHNDPTDRIPGVWVPQDQRRLVDSPKEHRGSAAPKGLPEGTEPKPKQFDLTPASVGSHSTRGTIAWPADVAKARKHKASRKVKGDGKKDGGGDGSGLLGEYFAGMDFEREVFRRPDRNIDFDWTGVAVDQKRMPVSKNFSVRWTGEICPRYSETYTFYTASDDGERLWIDGRLLVSNWTTHGPTEDVGRLTLEAGRRYRIKLEYFENDTPPAVMRLYWESPSQKKEYIPQSCLFYPKPRE